MRVAHFKLPLDDKGYYIQWPTGYKTYHKEHFTCGLGITPSITIEDVSKFVPNHTALVIITHD